MRAVAVTFLVAVTGCEAASPSPGLDQLLQIPNAQYRPGPFPEDDGGPRALIGKLRHASVVIGETGEQLEATLDV
nr:hypothetical protein [Deltaproteobacteria bacterium]